MPGCFACLKRRQEESYSPSNVAAVDTAFHRSTGDDLNSLDTLTNAPASDSVAKGDQAVGEQASRINFLVNDDNVSVGYPEVGQSSLLTVEEAKVCKKQSGKLATAHNMQGLEELVTRLEAVTTRLEKASGGGGRGAAAAPCTAGETRPLQTSESCVFEAG